MVDTGSVLSLAAVGAAAGALVWLWNQKEPLFWEWDNGHGDHARRIRIDTEDISFPKSFLWGVATAAHQIEGGCTNNNWHRWQQQKTRADGQPTLVHGEVSGVACDHWNRVEEDVGLVKQLGCNAYRFSVEWSRIEPQEGVFDEAAIAHYRKELELLIANGITPFVTLHHFTNPLWFEDRGAFEVADNIALVVRFAQRVFTEYSSLVKFWCTINEADVYTASGYFQGIFPPGKKDPQIAAMVLKNLLEAHVQVFYALKAMPNGASAQIGFVKNIFQFEPSRIWHPLDHYGASLFDGVFNESIIKFFKTGHFIFRMPGCSLVHFNESATRANDFIGLNYYSHTYVRFEFDAAEPFKFVPANGMPVMTDMSYPIYPEGFYLALKRLHRSLNLPIYVTENGLADATDDRRHLFLRRYLYALSRAMQEGVNCRGYFYWSLYDNFEWNEGYSMRFGLYAVDFTTQKRTLRDGAKYFVRTVQRFRGDQQA